MEIEINPTEFEDDKTDAFPYLSMKIVYEGTNKEQLPSGVYRLIEKVFYKIQ